MHNSSLVQSGTEFFVVAEDGGNIQLTEPSTTTITSARPPRFEVSGVHAVVVNSVSAPLIVDDSGIMLFMSPAAPTAAPTITSATAGALTGTYSVKYTFAIRNLDGIIVAESGFSPSASTGAIAAKKIKANNLQLLTGLTPANYNSRYDIVRRVYRTTTGTNTYFLWATVADNTTIFVEDDASDATISLIAADSLGTQAFLSHVASFRDRLFGVDDSTNREVLRYSETSQRWAWPTDNTFTMPQVKGDSQSGITALMPRRDALGIAKSNMLLQLTGVDDTDFRLITLSTSVGCVSQESCAIYRDQWYFLGQDGVYRWGEDGLTCISDGKVRNWFTSDTYFDRNEFVNAFATFDIGRKTYKLYLTTAGDTTVTGWVEYDIETGTWWGPHLSTYEFRSAFQLASHLPLVGEGTETGYITIDTSTRSDNAVNAIEVEAVITPIKITDPPVTAYFGHLINEVAPQASGTLNIYPITGEPSDAEETLLQHTLTNGTETLGRLGYGRYLILRFYNNTILQVVQLLGFEVTPVNVVGRRQ